jgi:chromosome segregation ATPase
MQADKDSQIQDEKDNLAIIQRELVDLETRARAAQLYLNNCQSETQNHSKQKKQLKIMMDRAHDDMGRLEDEVNACTPDAAQIEELEKDLVAAQERLEMDEKQYADFITQKDNADENARLLKSQLDVASNVLREAEDRHEKLSARIVTLTDRRVQALKRKNDAIDIVAHFKKNKAKWDEKRDQQQAEVAESLKEATRICPRIQVPSGESRESLQVKLQNKKKAREAAQSELGGSQEELITIANNAKKAYVDAQNMVTGTENVRSVSSSDL